MNLLNQPLSWDPNQCGLNPNFNMGGYGSSQAFGSSQNEPDFVPETRTKTQSNEEEPETQLNKTKCNKRVSHEKRNNRDPSEKKRATME
ncbi:hypothetical protein Hanom_Chr08g00703391 [Helianthus anomalus]